MSVGISSLNLYPNPTRGWVNIDLKLMNPGQVSIEVIDMRGKTLIGNSEITGNVYQGQLDLSKFVNGLYLLKISTNIGEINKRITRL